MRSAYFLKGSRTDQPPCFSSGNSLIIEKYKQRSHRFPDYLLKFISELIWESGASFYFYEFLSVVYVNLNSYSF